MSKLSDFLFGSAIITNKTTAYPLVAADLTGRKTFTNSGGGASVVPFTFPTAVIGNKVSFEVVDSGGLSIDPNGTEIIKINNVSMGAGNAVTFLTQGLKIDAICVVAGEWIVKSSGVKRGCLVYHNANQTLTAGVVTYIEWNTDTNGYNNEALHSTSSNTSRITIQRGMTKVRLSANLVTDGAGIIMECAIIKNRVVSGYEGAPSMSITISGAFRNYNIISPILNVTENDYFEVAMASQTTNGLLYASYQPYGFTLKSWFALEIIE